MISRKLAAGGFQDERVPRTLLVSPLRAKGAQPAQAQGLRRGCLGTVEWAGAGEGLCRRGIE
jgi:hypothetical protein